MIDFLNRYAPVSRPLAVLLAGGSGSGKSTLRRNLAQDPSFPQFIPGGVILDPDEIKVALPGYAAAVVQPGFDGSGFHAQAKQQITDLEALVLQQRYDLLLDVTLSNPRTSRLRLKALHQAGYAVWIFAVALPLTVALERVAQREQKNPLGHKVPRRDIIDTHQGFWVHHLEWAAAAVRFELWDSDPPGKPPGSLERLLFKNRNTGQVQFTDAQAQSRYTHIREEVSRS